MVLHASVFKVSGNRSYELRHPALMPQKYSSKYRHIDVSHFSNETSSLYVGIIFHSFKKLNQATLYFPLMQMSQTNLARSRWIPSSRTASPWPGPDLKEMVALLSLDTSWRSAREANQKPDGIGRVTNPSWIQLSGFHACPKARNMSSASVLSTRLVWVLL